MATTRELPKYQCHKIVWALKIQEVHEFHMVPEDPRYGPIEVEREYFAKHKPQAGGYYVVYDDGYKSFSPAAAFESGYAPLQPSPATVPGTPKMNKLQGKDYAALAFCVAVLIACIANIGSPAAEQGYVWLFTVVSAGAALLILFKKSDARK